MLAPLVEVSIAALIFLVLYSWQRYKGREERTKVSQNDIAPLLQFDWRQEPPLDVHKQPFLNAKKFSLTMGIRRCDANAFMLIDRNYESRMQARQSIMLAHPEDTLACHESATDSCHEALSVIADFLLRRYPTIFVEEEKGTITNRVTTQRIDKTVSGIEALQAISKLSEDDVLILKYDKDQQSYVLRAATSAFPNGFSFVSKVGKTLSSIHDPVPGYKEKLELSMDRYFHKLQVGNLVVRYNWGITGHSNLYAVSGTHLSPGQASKALPVPGLEDCHVRCERQVLRRLPKSRDILFSIKTYLTPVTKVAEDGGAGNLMGAIRGLTGDMGYYKGKPIWADVVEHYLEGQREDV